MKRSGDPAGAGGRCEDGGCLSAARRQQRDVLRVEGEVRRHGRVGGEAAEGARGGEREAQAALRGRHARQHRAEGPSRPKVVTPGRETAIGRASRRGLRDERAAGMPRHRRGSLLDPLSQPASRAAQGPRGRGPRGGRAGHPRLPDRPPAARITAAAPAPAPGRQDEPGPPEDPARHRHGTTRPGGAARRGARSSQDAPGRALPVREAGPVGFGMPPCLQSAGGIGGRSERMSGLVNPSPAILLRNRHDSAYIPRDGWGIPRSFRKSVCV
jgi:hypothetical protein